MLSSIRQYRFSVVNLFQNNRAKQIAHVLGHGQSETVAIVCVQHQPTGHKQCPVLHELMLKTLTMKAIAFQFTDHCLPISSDRHVSVGIITGARGDVLNLMIAFLSQTVSWTDIFHKHSTFSTYFVYCTVRVLKSVSEWHFPKGAQCANVCVKPVSFCVYGKHNRCAFDLHIAICSMWHDAHFHKRWVMSTLSLGIPYPDVCC